MMKRLRSRGLLYSAGTLINRVIPADWFRFRIFCVFELASAAERRAAGEQRGDPGREHDLLLKWCESPADFAAAQELTFYCPSCLTSEAFRAGVAEPSGSTASGHSPHAGHSPQACLAVDWAAPIAGVWCASDHFDESELGIRIRLAEAQSWIFAAYVAKSHRRRGVYRRLLNHVLGQSGGSGNRRFYASINPANKASIAAHGPFIRQVIGTCIAIRIFRWSTCWTTDRLRIDRDANPLEVVID